MSLHLISPFTPQNVQKCLKKQENAYFQHFSKKIHQNWQKMWENMSLHLISPFTPQIVQKCLKNQENANF